MTEGAPAAVAFDLGGVLIDWNPRYLYRTLFSDEEAMETFLAEVVSPDWNTTLDAGRPWAEAIATLSAEHPDQRELIEAFYSRWDEMLGGAFDDVVAILAELRAAGVPTYALSNWSADTYAVARRRYEFLEWFDGVVISGDVGAAKPDPRIFRHLVDRFGLDPATTVFVDDLEPNVAAARELGFVAIRFESAADLRRRLVDLGLPLGSDAGEPARSG